MDYVELGGSRVVDGIGKMLDAALGGPHGYTDSRLVDVQTALMIVEIAKIADDRDDWFPCGQWATIQAIQGRVEKQLKTLFANAAGEVRRNAVTSTGLLADESKGETR